MILKPGVGWKRVSKNAPVWEHETGIRIHAYGLMRFPNGNHRIFNQDSEGSRVALRITGGNKKRAIMIWALNASPETVTKGV